MRWRIFWLAAILVLAIACDKPQFKKPARLVSKDEMVDMLVDIHLAGAVYQTQRYTSERLDKLKGADFYYSVLKKYQVPDSTFEQSLIYYASFPRDFEKMYTRVLNRLNEMEQQYTEKEEKPVNIGND